jgi:phage terminase large subunit-like protein
MLLENFSFVMEAIRSNRLIRRKFAKYSHPLFFLIYLARYVKKPTADFQREMFKLLSDKKLDFIVITAFRGSGKSTICTTSFPIQSIISGKSHNIIIASQTQLQARAHLADIKAELESNELLANDLGPFKEQSDQWGAYALTFKDYDARIMCISTETAVRGIKYKEYRPDLIILDDIEDINSTRTKEARDKIHAWFTGEIIPLGNPDTKIIVLGNFLHEYSLVGRLRMEIENGQRSGVFKSYPLIDDNGVCLWPGMYPNAEAVEAQRRKINDEATWQREYCLKIIESDRKLLTLSQLHFYDQMPPKDLSHGYLYTWIGVDLAAGEGEKHDYTAMTTVQVHVIDGHLTIYVSPNFVYKHIDFDGSMAAMQQLLNDAGEPEKTKLFIESNGMQLGYYQHIYKMGYKQVVPIKSHKDKLFRLQPAIGMIKKGYLLFPRSGAQELVTELISFGDREHNDGCDSLSIVVNQIIEDATINDRETASRNRYYAGQEGPYVSDRRVPRFKASEKNTTNRASGLRPWQAEHLHSIHEQQKITSSSPYYAYMQEPVNFVIQRVRKILPGSDLRWLDNHTIALFEPEAAKVYALIDPADITRYLPELIDAFGRPFEQDEEMVSWNVELDYGKIIELYIASKNAEEPNMLSHFYEAIKHSPLLKRECANLLPRSGLLRDYVKKKFEIMNRIAPV